MNRVRCNIALFEGEWRMTPTIKVVRSVLDQVYRSSRGLVAIKETDPEQDVQLQALVVVETRWQHGEIVRDCIIEALLRRLGPEYDSMVEVEVLDD